MAVSTRRLPNVAVFPDFLLPFPLLLLFAFICLVSPRVSMAVPPAITPIPMELLNPRLTEFRRIDANNDDALSFSEYLQSDRPWMETLSRRYHQLDLNSDGRVSRKEFEAFFRGREEAEERQRNQADNFFKQLQTVTVGPIVEREQVGNATNGASRTRYFSAGARKYSTIAHGTGLFPASSSSSADSSFNSPSPSGDLPPPPPPSGASALLRDHDQRFRLFSGGADFPHPHHHHHHALAHHHFLPPSAAALLGNTQPGGNSAGQAPRSDDSTALLPAPFTDGFNFDQQSGTGGNVRPMMGTGGPAMAEADFNGGQIL